MLLWYTVQVFAQQELAYCSQFLIGLLIINPEKLCNPFDQERLSELERGCISVSNIYSEILVY
jgi:hypothetical protein